MASATVLSSTNWIAKMIVIAIAEPLARRVTYKVIGTANIAYTKQVNGREKR
jgi:hypothetical protein